ncbi:MAG: ankyrin repeat domain-containing protein [Bacillota bacterium]
MPKRPEITNEAVHAVKEDNPSKITRSMLSMIDEKEQSLLFYAVRFKAVKVLTHLLKEKLDPNIINRNHETPLFHAASLGATEEIAALYDGGAYPDMPNASQVTPLMVAAQKGNIETIEKLIQYDVDVNARDDSGRNPLFHAVMSNNPKTLQLLVDAGASADVLSYQFESLHHVCAQHGDLRMFKFIKALKVSPYIRTRYYETPLHRAAAKGKSDLVKAYLDFGLTPKEEDAFGSTPRTYGKAYGEMEMLFTRYENNLEIERAMKNQPLARLLRLRRFDEAEVYIHKRSFLDDKDYYENRPIFYALIYGDYRLIERLIGQGAKLDDIDCFHHDAAYYAQIFKDETIKTMLKNAPL